MTIIEQRDAAQNQVTDTLAKVATLEGALLKAQTERDEFAESLLATSTELTAAKQSLSTERGRSDSGLQAQIDALTSELEAARNGFDSAVAAKAQAQLAAVGAPPVNMTPTLSAAAINPISGDEILASYRKLAATDPAQKTVFYRANKEAILNAMRDEASGKNKGQ
jgi:hypothetical protein